MGDGLKRKLTSFLLLDISHENVPTYKLIRCHFLMALVLLAQTVSLLTLSNTGIEPWILMAYRCFCGLTFISFLSIFISIRDPIPIDIGTSISSYSHSIGQLFILILYYIHESEDGKINYCSMIFLPLLLFFGSFHEFINIFSHNNETRRKRFSRLIPIITGVFSTLISFPSILKFEYIRVQYNKIFMWVSVLLISIIAKLLYYFGIVKINKNNIKLFEVSASNILNISKVCIPIGILVHAYRLKKLLPNRDFSLFLIDIVRCDKKTIFYIFISSVISFGFVLPVQVVCFPQISLFEYSIYSIAPSVLTSGSIKAILILSITLLLQIYNRVSRNCDYSDIRKVMMKEMK